MYKIDRGGEGGWGGPKIVQQDRPCILLEPSLAMLVFSKLLFLPFI